MGMKIGLTEDDTRANYRQYTKGNRGIWKSLGFRMLTSQVHDEDRELILAELDTRKWQRMALTVEDAETSNNILHTIATRNMAKPPSKEDREAAFTESANSRARKEVQHFLEQARHYIRKHTNVKNNYDHEADYAKRVRMEAKGVAYMNLGVAYYRLAVVRLEHAGRSSVFGLRGEDEE